MKYALLWPNTVSTIPQHVSVPYHFVYLGEAANYLKKVGVGKIDILDAEAENWNYAQIARKIMAGYAVIALYTAPDNIGSVLKTLEFIKTITPETKTIAYGHLPLLLPEFFVRTDFDALVTSGDPERSLADYFEYISKKRTKDHLRGITLIDNNSLTPTHQGVTLNPKEWGFPNIREISLDKYSEMQSRSQIVFTFSRGCPYGCNFCTASLIYGNENRKRDIVDIITYLQDIAVNTYSFKFFSPNFTLDSDYVKEFCKALIKETPGIRWSCTTRPDLLDDAEMIRLMAEAGCYKVAMGIETLVHAEQKTISKLYDFRQIEHAVGLLRKNSIRAKALIMIGLPTQSRDSLFYTFSKLKEIGAEIRPAAYTPYDQLTPTMDISQIEQFDKRTFYAPIEGLTKTQFFHLIYEPENFREILQEI